MNICLECGNETKNNKFCSKSCSAKRNGHLFPKRKKEGRCKQCGLEISSSRSYCSSACRSSGLMAVRGERIARNPKPLKDGKPPWVWDSDISDGKGFYRAAKCPTHPNADSKGYVHVHRLVMENAIGRLLGSNEIVHHINHIRTDNDLENLQLMTRSEHSRLHNIKKGITWILLNCKSCKKQFKRRKGQVKDPNNSFCSRECLYSSQRLDQSRNNE